MKQLIRNAHIGVGVCAVIYAVGLFLFHDNETAVGIVGGVGLAACLGIALGLNERYYRLRDREHRSR